MAGGIGGRGQYLVVVRFAGLVVHAGIARIRADAVVRHRFGLVDLSVVPADRGCGHSGAGSMSAANPFGNDASMMAAPRPHAPAMEASSSESPMDWATVTLPKTWPDITPWWRPAMALKLLSK